MSKKTKNIILAIVVSAIAIFLPAWLLNKWAEAVFFFMCHWFVREQFPKQYHHIVPAMCRLITSAVFFFGVCFVLPRDLSLLSAIPINYFVGWVGFTKKQADTYELKYNRLKEQLEKDNKFDVETCTEEQLFERCREVGLSQENTELAFEFFVTKTKQSVIADKLCINEKSVQTRKKRLKQKLNKKK